MGGSVEADQRRVHAVERRARHETDPDGRALGHGGHRRRIADDGPEPAGVRREQRLGLLAVHTAPRHHDGGLDPAIGALQHLRRRRPARSPGRFHHDAMAPVLELRVRGAKVDHEVAVGLAQPDHRAGGDGVEHELGGGAGLHPGGAGDHLGPDEHDDADVAGVREQGRAVRRRPRGRCAHPAPVPGPAPRARTAWCRWRRCR